MTAAVKLTPWYPVGTKPARRGLYQCREGKQYKWYWDGNVWRSPLSNFVCQQQDRSWRGLAADPAGGAK